MALDAAGAIERVRSVKAIGSARMRWHGSSIFSRRPGSYRTRQVDRGGSSVRQGAKPDSVLGQSPFAPWTTLYLAVDAFYRRHLDEAAHALEPLLETTASRAYLTLGGRANRVRGLIHFLSGQFGDALDRYRRALCRLHKRGYTRRRRAASSTLAETLEQVGDYRTAWSHWQLALGGLSSARTPRRRQTILVTAAIAAKQAHLFAVGLQFQNELLADELQSRRPGAIVEALIGRAESHHRLGNRQRATEDIGTAEEWLARVPNRELARLLEAEVRLIQGEILERTEPERALAALNDSLAYLAESKMVRRVPRVSLAMGRVHHHAGRDDAAEASFLEGIRELERYRSEVPPGELRLAYLNQPWNVFDEMIGLQATRPERAQRALSFAERGRARDLLDRASRSGDATLIDPTTLTGTLPPHTVALYYATIDTQLLIWIISSGRVELFRRPIGISDLSRHAQAFAAAIQNNRADEIAVESAVLYDEVIRPVEARLSAGVNVVVIPDGPLHGVPFAALRDSRTGRYLVKRIIWSRSRRRHDVPARVNTLKGRSFAATQRMLVIGNPRLDRTDAQNLPNLSGAEDDGPGHRHAVQHRGRSDRGAGDQTIIPRWRGRRRDRALRRPCACQRAIPADVASAARPRHRRTLRISLRA